MIDNTPDDSKVGIASIHSDGLASSWHQAMVHEDVAQVLLRSWRVYKNLIRYRFEEVLDDPTAELKELREVKGIAEYHAKFEVIRA